MSNVFFFGINYDFLPLQFIVIVMSSFLDARFWKITIYIILWYITSIFAGIYNKAFLNIHRLPILLTFSQGFVDVLCGVIFLFFYSRVYMLHSIYEAKMLSLLGLIHFVGTLLTNWSTLESSASFTHTIKVIQII